MSKKISAIAITGFALLVLLGCGMPGDGTECRDDVHEDGPGRPIPHGGSKPPKSPWRAVQRRSPLHAMQRCWFLDGMVSKRRSKARTASCVSWDAGGHPLRMLTIGIRKCGFPCV